MLSVQVRENLKYVPTDVLSNMTKRLILVIMGPAGCGKSSVAKAVSEKLRIPMVEGDDVRTPCRDP